MDSLLNSGDQPEFDENKDWLSELVGEGKKFKDEKELAKSKAYADAHIKVVESRMDALSEDHRKVLDELRTRASLEELVTKLESKIQQPSSRETTPISNEENRPTFDLTKVEDVFSNKLAQYEQTRKETENFNLVESKTKERFGNTYKSVLTDKAKSLGLSDKDVVQMARTNPDLFFKTFDVNAQKNEPFDAPPRSSGFTPKAQEKRGWSYYQKLKKDNPRAWMDRKVAIQMEKDAQSMGIEAFYAS